MKCCPGCKKYKPITEYNQYFSKRRNKMRRQGYCKICEPEQNKKRGVEYYEKHKSERQKYQRVYRQKNKEVIKIKRREYKRRQIEELQNCYVREILVTRNKIEPRLISPEILDTKRALLKLKRKIKAIKNEK